MENQETNGRYVVVNQVVAQQEGWVVITDRNDPNKQYGRAKVGAGYNSHVEVIFLNQVAPKGANLRASLYVDAGVLGKFEPQTDTLLGAKDFVLRNPLLKVSNQQVKNGKIAVDEIFANQDGWVVLYDGKPSVVGYAPVAAGSSESVSIPIGNSLQTEQQLTAVLHVDLGQKSKFEFPGADTVVLVNDKMVQASFIATPMPTVTTTPTSTVAPTPSDLPPIESINPTQRCSANQQQPDSWDVEVPLVWQMAPANVDMKQYPDYYLVIVVWPPGVDPLTDSAGAPAIIGELANPTGQTLRPKSLAVNKLILEKTDYRWGIVLIHRGDNQRIKRLTPDCWFRIPDGFSAP